MTKHDKSPVSSASDGKHASKSNAGAYERGANAGKQKDTGDGNPYPEGSSAAKSFEHGQLDAQKVRSSDKPPGR
ncbi:Sf3a2-prov protein [Rhizobium sp. A37_96]